MVNQNIKIMILFENVSCTTVKGNRLNELEGSNEWEK